MSTYGKFMAAIFLVTWIVFIWFADHDIVHIINSGIAGFAVGSWVFDVCHALWPKVKND